MSPLPPLPHIITATPLTSCGPNPAYIHSVPYTFPATALTHLLLLSLLTTSLLVTRSSQRTGAVGSSPTPTLACVRCGVKQSVRLVLHTPKPNLAQHLVLLPRQATALLPRSVSLVVIAAVVVWVGMMVKGTAQLREWRRKQRTAVPLLGSDVHLSVRGANL
jgi:hypothetical protein